MQVFHVGTERFPTEDAARAHAAAMTSGYVDRTVSIVSQDDFGMENAEIVGNVAHYRAGKPLWNVEAIGPLSNEYWSKLTSTGLAWMIDGGGIPSEGGITPNGRHQFAIAADSEDEAKSLVLRTIGDGAAVEWHCSPLVNGELP